MKHSTVKVIWVTCTGEAHSNPMIDHCGVCAPYWERYPVCPSCKSKLTDTPTRYTCKKCAVWYTK